MVQRLSVTGPGGVALSLVWAVLTMSSSGTRADVVSWVLGVDAVVCLVTFWITLGQLNRHLTNVLARPMSAKELPLIWVESPQVWAARIGLDDLQTSGVENTDADSDDSSDSDDSDDSSDSDH
jgi:hypothetical protein